MTADGREQRFSLRLAINRDDIASAVTQAVAGMMGRTGEVPPESQRPRLSG